MAGVLDAQVQFQSDTAQRPAAQKGFLLSGFVSDKTGFFPKEPDSLTRGFSNVLNLLHGNIKLLLFGVDASVTGSREHVFFEYLLDGLQCRIFAVPSVPVSCRVEQRA